MRLLKFSFLAFVFSLLIPDIYSVLEFRSQKNNAQEQNFKRALNVIKQGDEAEHLDALIWDLKSYEYDNNYEKRFWYAYILALKYKNDEKNEKISQILSCNTSEKDCDLRARKFRLAEEICRYSNDLCEKVSPYWYSQAKL